MLKNWKSFQDNRGCLTPIELSDLPFTPKRIFIVSDVPKGETRGMHSHYKTKQVLVCLQGEILVNLHDGVIKHSQLLKKNDSIFVDNLIWDSQIYLTGNDILLSICSTEHDPDDHIRDFDEFIKIKTI